VTQPVLNIIIPTLKRPDTLRYTLRTVLNQQYDNYTIIVSDNFSNDETQELVSSFNDKRIKYINPGRRLSMSRHWEFALQHVTEGFVTILGDDDGMLPGALQKVASIIQKNKVDAVGWRFGNFNWKGLPPYFMIPMANYYRIVNAETETKKIFNGSTYDTIQFPSLYGGFIDIVIIKKIRDRFGGEFFHSRIPDFFSGAIIAATLAKYIRLEFPITINATSKHSTGYATINKANNQSAFIDLQKGDDNVSFHPKLIFIRSNAVPIAEAMLQVHELVPSFPEIDIKKVLSEVVAEAIVTQDHEKFEELTAGVRNIAINNKIESYADSLLTNIKHQPAKDVVKKKFSPLTITLYVDTTDTDIENVEDACNFAASVISPRFYRLGNSFFRNYCRISMLVRYILLKFFSSKRKYL